MATNDEIEWLDSNATMARVAAVMGKEKARLAIAGRARDGLIRTRALLFIAREKPHNNFDLPASFWSSGGHEGLDQNWTTGDFSTLNKNGKRWTARGVSFCMADIDAMLPVAPSSDVLSSASKSPAPKQAGRLPAEWWDDLWVEICRQLYEGDLKPKTQADIKTAMLTWVENSGNTAAESTIRTRAQKLWAAIKPDSKN